MITSFMEATRIYSGQAGKCACGCSGKYFEKNYKKEMENSGMRADDDIVLLDAGMALMEDKDYDNAISLYKIYTSLFPEIVVAWNELGEAYLKVNDKQNARSSFEQVLKLRPENPRAKRGLEKCH